MAKLPTYAKYSLTIEQQIELLVERGLKIENCGFAAHALANVSYYRLSAYSYPFRSRQTPGRFVGGASFETVWRYYRFDRRLKSVVLDAIERVEISVRTKLVNVFTAEYGPFGYREAANFASPIDARRFAATLGFIDRETQKSNEEFVAHFRATYDTTRGLPLWMATEVMTFGNLLTFFAVLGGRSLCVGGEGAPFQRPLRGGFAGGYAGGYAETSGVGCPIPFQPQGNEAALGWRLTRQHQRGEGASDTVRHLQNPNR